MAVMGATGANAADRKRPKGLKGTTPFPRWPQESKLASGTEPGGGSAGDHSVSRGKGPSALRPSLQMTYVNDGVFDPSKSLIYWFVLVKVEKLVSTSKSEWKPSPLQRVIAGTAIAMPSNSNSESL